MRRLITVLVCAAFLAPAVAGGADLPIQVTDTVVAFGELQHVALIYSQLSICTIPGLPESCTPLLSNANHNLILNEVAGIKVGLAKFPSGWRATATAGLESIRQQLDDAGRARLAPYLALVRAVIAGSSP